MGQSKCRKLHATVFDVGHDCELQLEILSGLVRQLLGLPGLFRRPCCGELCIFFDPYSFLKLTISF